MSFGQHLRTRREALAEGNKRFSLRQTAQRAGIEPAYLSKIEREEFAPPGEETIRSLARELGEDPDVLLAMAGKVGSDLQAIIRSRPRLFAALLRQLRSAPDDVLEHLAMEVKDGDW